MAIRIWFRFEVEALAAARRRYRHAQENPDVYPWAVTHSGDPNPAAELWEHALVAEVQISNDGRTLFRRTGSHEGEGDVNVGWVLFGLLHAVSAARTERQVMLFAPDYQEIWVEIGASDELCVSTSSETSICAPREEWLRSLDRALAELRTVLNAEMPELAHDQFLSNWLSGGQPPLFVNLVGSP